MVHHSHVGEWVYCPWAFLAQFNSLLFSTYCFHTLLETARTSPFLLMLYIQLWGSGFSLGPLSLCITISETGLSEKWNRNRDSSPVSGTVKSSFFLPLCQECANPNALSLQLCVLCALVCSLGPSPLFIHVARACNLDRSGFQCKHQV